MPPRKRNLKAVPAAPTGEMAGFVREAVGKLVLQPEDAAVAELAVRYARTIDDAAELADAAARVEFDPDTAAQVARLKQRVDAHQVMIDVGPKLLAALTALGASPAARAAVGKPAQGGKRSVLAALRDGAS